MRSAAKREAGVGRGFRFVADNASSLSATNREVKTYCTNLLISYSMSIVRIVFILCRKGGTVYRGRRQGSEEVPAPRSRVIDKRNKVFGLKNEVTLLTSGFYCSNRSTFKIKSFFFIFVEWGPLTFTIVLNAWGIYTEIAGVLLAPLPCTCCGP